MNIQDAALQFVKDNLSSNTRLSFKNNSFTFYVDNCGQRGHCLVPYNSYGTIIENHYVVIRLLSFENQIDLGKNGAILGVLNLNKCKAIAIKENSIEFDLCTIEFEYNPQKHKADKYFDGEYNVFNSKP
jgi:hypothetical protein